MLEIKQLGSFKKDLKLMRKRGKNLRELQKIVDILAADMPLQLRHRPHRLTGNWIGHWECHVEPDWLLIYRIEEEALVLVRTGTHADLFD